MAGDTVVNMAKTSDFMSPAISAKAIRVGGDMIESFKRAYNILVSATINGADLIGRTKSVGTLEVGKVADVIAMHGSPLNDIDELLDVDFVMKSGEVVKQK